ncbi:4Fe-4S dicluster domain-containing protein [Candidatus Calescamantes bacterium]|nr:4Fe-4S dicluster domain-containing protein [Candidatus Calescamantes bacterium]MCK5599389.1 4Fe-4S dicluster domain-containing protein [bacterium]
MSKKIIEITDEGNAFLEKVNELSGQVVTLCDQCGTCSGCCPMAEEMDITPSQINRMVQLGQVEVLDLEAIWLCASCFTCTVRCPRGLDPSKICESLRQMTLRKAIDYMDIRDISEKEMRRLPQIAIVSAFRKFTG